jgi:hypothetical protein
MVMLRIALIPIWLFALTGTGHATEPGQLTDRPPCFDFSKKSTRILSPSPYSYPEIGRESRELGTDAKTGLDWARVAGMVKLPIEKVNTKLLDQMTTRNPKTTTITTESLTPNGALTRTRVAIRVKPVFFITLEWEEEWAHTLIEGTPEAPKEILISYQKTKGTSHIRHFCGNILLKALSPTTTGVFLYEQIDADQRDPDEVADGLLGTLKTLRP